MLGFKAQSTHMKLKKRAYKFKKSKEVDRVRGLRSGVERKMKKGFRDFLKTMRSDEKVEQLKKLYDRGDLKSITELADGPIKEYAEVLRKAYIDVANKENKDLQLKLGVEFVQKIEVDPSISLTFDPGQPETANAIRQMLLEFIKEITRTQRNAIREAMASALDAGLGSIEASKTFRNVIGLTVHQTSAVDNYASLLAQNNRDALTRVLRDRRFDSTVRNAIENDEPLSGAQINRMVDRYRSRMLDMRAETIARTEAQAATQQARQKSLDQMTDKLGFEPERIKRVWNTTIDGRERDTHQAMDGQRRNKDEAFESPSGAKLMYPGDQSAPADEVINCRCVITIEVDE